MVRRLSILGRLGVPPAASFPACAWTVSPEIEVFFAIQSVHALVVYLPTPKTTKYIGPWISVAHARCGELTGFAANGRMRRVALMWRTREIDIPSPRKAFRQLMR